MSCGSALAPIVCVAKPSKRMSAGDDQQAEAEQSPVSGWTPEAAPVERAQGFFPCPSALPGTVATVVVAVVVVVVVVVVCFTCPGATVDFPRTRVVDVCPGATPERPGDVVVVFVCPGARADLPWATEGVVLVAGAGTGAGSGRAGRDDAPREPGVGGLATVSRA